MEDTLVVVANVSYDPAISKSRRNANGLGPRPRPIMFDRPGGLPSFVESGNRSWEPRDASGYDEAHPGLFAVSVRLKIIQASIPVVVIAVHTLH